MSELNDIKVSEILRHLRARVEDDNDLGFSKQQKLDCLDTAQRHLCTVIHNNYLKNIEVTDFSVGCDVNGKIPLTKLAHKVFRNDIIGITTFKEGNIHSLDRVEFDDIGRLNHSYLRGNYDYQVWYQHHQDIYIYPTNVIMGFDISYIKEPALFFDDEDNTEAENCELDITLLDPLLDFAEANIWKIDNKPNRVKLAFELGVSKVNLLNQRYAQERAVGMGQVGKGMSE